MLKLKSVLSVEVNGRGFEFLCPTDSPIADALDANSQINAFLLGRMQQGQNAQKEQEQPKVEEQSN